MVGAFLFDATEASSWLQDCGRETPRLATRLAVPSLPRAVPEARIFSLELNDHTFFYRKLKGIVCLIKSLAQPLEISAVSCNKHTDVRFFSGRPAGSIRWRARSVHMAPRPWRRFARPGCG